jgi:hypothetical protein
MQNVEAPMDARTVDPLGYASAADDFWQSGAARGDLSQRKRPFPQPLGASFRRTIPASEQMEALLALDDTPAR